MIAYVDDLIVTGNSATLMSQFIDSLSYRFSPKI